MPTKKQRDAYDLCVLHRAGWPRIPPADKREAHLKRKMGGRRYDEPGQIVSLKGDRR